MLELKGAALESDLSVIKRVYIEKLDTNRLLSISVFV